MQGQLIALLSPCKVTILYINGYKYIGSDRRTQSVSPLSHCATPHYFLPLYTALLYSPQSTTFTDFTGRSFRVSSLAISRNTRIPLITRPNATVMTYNGEAATEHRTGGEPSHASRSHRGLWVVPWRKRWVGVRIGRVDHHQWRCVLRACLSGRGWRSYLTVDPSMSWGPG